MNKTMKRTLLSLLLVVAIVFTFGLSFTMIRPNSSIRDSIATTGDASSVTAHDDAVITDGSVPTGYVSDTKGEPISSGDALKTWLARGDAQGNAYLTTDVTLDWGASANGNIFIPYNDRDKYNIKEGVTLDGCGYSITLKSTTNGQTPVTGNNLAGEVSGSKKDTEKVYTGAFAKNLAGTVKNVKFATDERTVEANNGNWWVTVETGGLFYYITSTGVLYNCSFDYKWNYKSTIGRIPGILQNAGSLYLFGVVAAHSNGTVKNFTVNNYNQTYIYAKEGGSGNAEVYAGGFFAVAEENSRTYNVTYNNYYTGGAIFSLGAYDYSHAGIIAGESQEDAGVHSIFDGVIIDLGGFTNNYKYYVTYNEKNPVEKHVGFIEGRTGSNRNTTVKNIYSAYTFSGQVYINDGNHGKAITYSYPTVNTADKDNYKLYFEKNPALDASGDLIIMKDNVYESGKVFYDITYGGNMDKTDLYQVQAYKGVKLPKYNVAQSNTAGISIDIVQGRVGSLNEFNPEAHELQYGNGTNFVGSRLFSLPSGVTFADKFMKGTIKNIEANAPISNGAEVPVKYSAPTGSSILYNDTDAKVVVYNTKNVNEVIVDKVIIIQRVIHVNFDNYSMQLGGANAKISITDMPENLNDKISGLGSDAEGYFEYLGDNTIKATKATTGTRNINIKISNDGGYDVTPNYAINYTNGNAISVNPIVFTYDKYVKLGANSRNVVLNESANEVVVNTLGEVIEVTAYVPANGIQVNGLLTKLDGVVQEGNTSEQVQGADIDTKKFNLTVNTNFNTLTADFRNKEFDLKVEGDNATVEKAKATYGETVKFTTTGNADNFVGWMKKVGDEWVYVSSAQEYRATVRGDMTLKAVYSENKANYIKVIYYYNDNNQVYKEFMIEKTGDMTYSSFMEQIKNNCGMDSQLYMTFVGWETAYSEANFNNGVEAKLYPKFETTKKVSVTITTGTGDTKKTVTKEYNYNDVIELKHTDEGVMGWAVDGVFITAEKDYNFIAITDCNIVELIEVQDYSNAMTEGAHLTYVKDGSRHYFVGTVNPFISENAAKMSILSYEVGTEVIYETPIENYMVTSTGQFIIEVKYGEIVTGAMKAIICFEDEAGFKINDSNIVEFNING